MIKKVGRAYLRMRGRFLKWWKRPHQTDARTVHPDELVELTLAQSPQPASRLEAPGTSVITEVDLLDREELHPDLQVIDIPVAEVANPTVLERDAVVSAIRPVQLTLELEEVLFSSVDLKQNQPGADEVMSRSVNASEINWPSSDHDELLLDHDFDDEIEALTYDCFAPETAGFETLEDPLFSDNELFIDNDDDALLDIAFDGAAAIWETDLDLPVDDGGWLGDDPYREEEYATQEWRLEEYAAQIVLATPILKLHERGPLSRRVRAILEEFPFAATAVALKRLASDGASIDELEDACCLKCVWRDSSWLWLQRRYNRMQRGWRLEVNAKLKNNLTWITALRFIRRYGVDESERLLTEEILSRWRSLEVGAYNPEERAQFWFNDYSAFLAAWDEAVRLHDTNSWFYEEPLDVRWRKSISLIEDGQQIWTVEAPDVRW